MLYYRLSACFVFEHVSEYDTNYNYRLNEVGVLVS